MSAVKAVTIPIDACICDGKVIRPRRNCWATTHNLKAAKPAPRRAVVYPELTPAGPQRWTLTVDGVVGEVVMRGGCYDVFVDGIPLGAFARLGPAGSAIQQEVRGYVDMVDVEDE